MAPPPEDGLFVGAETHADKASAPTPAANILILFCVMAVTFGLPKAPRQSVETNAGAQNQYDCARILALSVENETFL